MIAQGIMFRLGTRAQRIPTGGSILGTALIMGAGGKTRWANIFVGFFVAVTVILAAIFMATAQIGAVLNQAVSAATSWLGQKR
jgi:MFS superfamily sulfate permease-like transporter